MNLDSDNRLITAADTDPPPPPELRRGRSLRPVPTRPRPCSTTKKKKVALWPPTKPRFQTGKGRGDPIASAHSEQDGHAARSGDRRGDGVGHLDRARGRRCRPRRPEPEGELGLSGRRRARRATTIGRAGRLPHPATERLFGDASSRTWRSRCPRAKEARADQIRAGLSGSRTPAAPDVLLDASPLSHSVAGRGADAQDPTARGASASSTIHAAPRPSSPSGSGRRGRHRRPRARPGGRRRRRDDHLTAPRVRPVRSVRSLSGRRDPCRFGTGVWWVARGG